MKETMAKTGLGISLAFLVLAGPAAAQDLGSLPRLPSLSTLASPYTATPYTSVYSRPTTTPRTYGYSPRPIRTTVDLRSGNIYHMRPQADGSTQVYGQNPRTGSMWTTNVKPNGDMWGTDSRGNPWIHISIKSYLPKPGTGKTCVGRGAARVCF